MLRCSAFLAHKTVLQETNQRERSMYFQPIGSEEVISGRESVNIIFVASESETGNMFILSLIIDQKGEVNRRSW